MKLELKELSIAGLASLELAPTMVRKLKSQPNTFEFGGKTYCWRQNIDGYVFNEEGKPLTQSMAHYIEKGLNRTIEFAAMVDDTTIDDANEWIALFEWLAGSKLKSLQGS